MQTKKLFIALALNLTLFLIACNPQTIVPPTPIPLAALPPTATSTLPPTLDLNTMTSATPAETAVPPTRKPTPTPTAIDPRINITDPKENELVFLGSELPVRGLVQRDESHHIMVSLTTSNGRLLAQEPGTPGDIGWQTSFPIPINVSGAATLQAGLYNESGELLSFNEIPIFLVLDKDASDRYLELLRPHIQDTAVSGFNVFFDGMILRPVNNTISISIWADDCQTRVARQSFVLGRSNRAIYWQGFVIVPRDVVGPVCAVASTGEPETEEWREAQIPIEVLPVDDINARGVIIGNPPPEDEVTAGEELLLYGAALNVSEGPVLATILMENGRVVSQSSFFTDYWGYWETSVLLPFDVEGFAEIVVSAGEGDTFAESQTRIFVNPAPTPTPGP